MSITPDKSYNIQIFKGNNWELTFEKSDGIEVLDSAHLIGRDMGIVDLRLQKQDFNRCRIKLIIDGKEFDAKGFGESGYIEMLDKFTTRKMTIDDIKKMLELFVNLT